MQRRSFVTTALAASAAPSLAAPPVPQRHTFVLQHGAWHGGWCWSRVSERLQSLGHKVFTPTATGLGERSHLASRDVTIDVFVTDLVASIEAEELRDVVLVGHSFGGLAISGAADRLKPRLRRLVYLDAAILQPGESILGTLSPDIAKERRAAIRAAGGVVIPPPPPAYFGVTDPVDAAWLRRRLTPHPAMTYDTPLDLRGPVGNGIPSTYIACTVDPLMSIEPMRQWARRQARSDAGWRYEELATAHDAMVTAPDLLTAALLRAAAD